MYIRKLHAHILSYIIYCSIFKVVHVILIISYNEVNEVPDYNIGLHIFGLYLVSVLTFACKGTYGLRLWCVTGHILDLASQVSRKATDFLRRTS